MVTSTCYDSARTVQERERRFLLWNDLRSAVDPAHAPKSLLRDLSIYGGAQGIWVDASRTKEVSADDYGVTVAVLHTGSKYPDDVGEDSLLYHYPQTGRPVGRDRSEIEATKNAGKLGIPVFVLIDRDRKTPLRKARIGWVEDWDDQSGLFLISFGESQPTVAPTADADQPFTPFEEKKRRWTQSAQRSNAQRFRLAVFKKYGAQCAVCTISIPELVDATHLVPWADGGTDDPRNGLPLCALHHKALDAGIFALKPDSSEIIAREGLTKQNLLIQRDSISHLPQAPHPAAVEFVWKRFVGASP